MECGKEGWNVGRRQECRWQADFNRAAKRTVKVKWDIIRQSTYLWVKKMSPVAFFQAIISSTNFSSSVHH